MHALSYNVCSFKSSYDFVRFETVERWAAIVSEFLISKALKPLSQTCDLINKLSLFIESLTSLFFVISVWLAGIHQEGDWHQALPWAQRYRSFRKCDCPCSPVLQRFIQDPWKWKEKVRLQIYDWTINAGLVLWSLGTSQILGIKSLGKRSPHFCLNSFRGVFPCGQQESLVSGTFISSKQFYCLLQIHSPLSLV